MYEGIIGQISALQGAYVGSATTSLAQALEPVGVSLMGIYVALWGLMHMLGKIEEPVMEFVMRAMKMGIVGGVSLGLWHYNEVISNVFIHGPDELMGAIASNARGMGVGEWRGVGGFMDSIMDNSIKVSDNFMERGDPWTASGWKVMILGGLVFLLGVVTTGYGAFLIILSKITMAVVLGIGPLFLLGLFFQTTQRYFESWISTLSNFALIPLLVTGMCLFTVGMYDNALSQALAQGAEIKDVAAVPLIVISGISLLVMAQIPAMAGMLAGGIGLQTYGMGRAAIAKAMGITRPVRNKVADITKKAALKTGSALYSRTLGRAVDAYKSRRNRISEGRTSRPGRNETAGQPKAKDRIRESIARQREARQARKAA